MKHKGLAVVAKQKAEKKKSSLELVAKRAARAKAASDDQKPTAQSREVEVANLILNHRENGRKLARSILRRWRVRMPADEIDSIVDLALCEAAGRYSSERGASFMTFLFYHLRGHLVRTVARAAQNSNFFPVNDNNSLLEASEWQHFSSEALWSFMPDHMLFGQRDIETPEHMILRREKINECRKALSKLDDLEKEIIMRSFSGEQALVDIARSLGYSRCHISRVKKSALERLKVILGNASAAKESAVQTEKASEALSERMVVSSARGRAKRRSRRRSVNRVAQLACNSRTRAA